MTENGFEYVDLGLPSGTMWATCNVGATKPEDPGILFQFGRVDGYKYDDENHKFRTNVQNLEYSSSRYIPITTTGKAYKEKERLDLADDAARVHMCGKWKTPTNNDLEELIDNTTHDVVTVNGVKGMIFTSIINSKQLFIPFAGFWYNGYFNTVGSYACIWSSIVHAYIVSTAYSLCCNSSGDASFSNYYRSCAFSVRGVFYI